MSELSWNIFKCKAVVFSIVLSTYLTTVKTKFVTNYRSSDLFFCFCAFAFDFGFAVQKISINICFISVCESLVIADVLKHETHLTSRLKNVNENFLKSVNKRRKLYVDRMSSYINLKCLNLKWTTLNYLNNSKNRQ